MNTPALEFVENLRRERKKAGLKQREVAELLNLNRSTYSYYENLKTPHMPDIDTICKIAEIFGCEVSDLLPKNKSSVLVHSSNGKEFKSMEVSLEEQRLLSLFRSCSEDERKRIMMNVLDIAVDYDKENEN